MINKVILVGRLGKEPITRQTQTGKSVATFSMATSESYKDDKGEWQERAEWHNIVMWDNQLNFGIVQKLQKGDLVYVEGKVRTRAYEHEGQTKYITEILPSVLRRLSWNNAEHDYSQKEVPPQQETEEMPEVLENLPF